MPDQPRPLTGLADIAANYPYVICDLWGVLHNGVEAFAEARDALVRFREDGGFAALVSNSPRLSRLVARQIAGLGIGSSAYDALITSGDLTRRKLERDCAGKRFFHLGPRKDRDTVEGLPLDEVDAPDEADVLVATGLIFDTAEEHEDLLRPAAERGIPFFCANPDRIVQHGRRLELCAGAVADRYEALGGPVAWLGKPAPPPYEACRRLFARHAGEPVADDRILMIGDSLPTDITGARREGFASLFVETGIHAGELDEHDGGRLFRHFGVTPDYRLDRLRWS